LVKGGDKSITTAEKKRTEAKGELDKYIFYFERYNNHDKAEKHARTLRPVIKTKIDMLHSLKKYPMQELEFLEQAINEVIRCR
jgi:ariadne-1